MSLRTSRNTLALVLSVCVLGLGSPATAQGQQPPATDSHLVASSALAKLVPTLDGWTRGEVRTSEVDMTSCTYRQASALYVKGDIRVRLTIADTGAHADSIMALASPLIILPETYAETVPPATTIKRLKIDGSPASEMWDAAKMTGEIALLAGGRFVVTIEALKGDSLETIRTVLGALDLKALAALK